MIALRMPRERLLWSGGFDSTFYLLSRLRVGAMIETVYMPHDLGWQKQRREMEARWRILNALPPEIRAHVVMPAREADDAPESYSPEWWSRFWTKRSELGRLLGVHSTQNAALCVMGEVFGPLTVGLVADDETAREPPMLEALGKHGLRMPLLARSKRELLAEASAAGFADLLGLTWSCEGSNADAAHGPCGACLSCQHRIIPARTRFALEHRRSPAA